MYSLTSRRRGRWLILAGALLLALLLLWGGWRMFIAGAQQGKKSTMAQQTTVTVAAVPAEIVKWRDQIQSVGTLQAVQGIEVTSEVAGKVASIQFAAGDEVREGETLIELDTSAERAKLRSIEAQLEQARTEAARTQRLLKQGAIAKQQVEQEDTQAVSLSAQAEQQRAIILKKLIRAPFAGDLGIRMVDLGEYVQPGQAIVTLVQLTPIYVNFNIPEKHYASVARGQRIHLQVEAFPEQTFQGQVSAINPKIDENTRNFSVQATIANTDRRLRPGMFAEVMLELPNLREVVIVPVTAISFNAYGKSVYQVRDAREYQREQVQTSGGRESRERLTHAGREVSKSETPQLVAQRTFVRTGEQRDLMVEIREGIVAGDRVVTAGQMKLQDGRPITVTEDEAFKEAEPRPTEP